MLDTMEYGHRNAVIEAELVVGDIADLDLVVELCTRRDITQVVHFAAYKSVGESMEQPSRYWLNNVAGTVKLVEAMLTAGVNDIVFSSSCSVYGNPADGAGQRGRSRSSPRASTPRRRRSSSGSCTGTASPTGCARSACATSTPPAPAPTAASARTGAQSLNLVPLVMKATLGRRPPVQVFGDDYPTPDGTCIRDYIHVDDLADAHVKALDYLGRGRSVDALNVGTGIGSSVMEVIAATERITGRPVPWTVAPRRAGDPVAMFADPTRASDVLGWQPAHGLDDIIASAWKWHSTHLDGYDSTPSP